MEIEEAIILALSEPRNYSNLRMEARKIRRQHEETLSNEGFEEALKRLRDEKIADRKEINGREVEYSLNLKSSNLVKNVIFAIGSIKERSEWVERFTKFIERKANEIDEGRNEFIKMGLKQVVEHDQLHLFVVREYQILAMNLIKFILSMQKATFFFTSKIWNFSFTKKHQLEHQKKYSELIDRLVDASMKLDKASTGSIHTIVRQELAKEMMNNQVDLERAEMLVKNPKLLFYKTLSQAAL